MTDLHTHIIPGVDDGAPDLESALRALATMVDDGVTAVAATPHLSASDLNSARRLRAERAWPELVECAGERFPGLELYRGYEIQLDVPELDLSDGDLRLGESRFALIEFPAFIIPPRSAATLGQIVAHGYVPILAHPERYWGYDSQLRVVREWREAGARVQLNGGSLLGEYGDSVQRMAMRFLRDGNVDLLASDNHARPNRSPSLAPVWDLLVSRGLEEVAKLLLAVNPRRVLQDEPLLEVPPAELRSRRFDWLSRAFKKGG